VTTTPEQARANANRLLAVLYADVTDWTEAIFDQALLAIAGTSRPFSANDLWQVLPESGRGTCGLYFADQPEGPRQARQRLRADGGRTPVHRGPAGRPHQAVEGGRVMGPLLLFLVWLAAGIAMAAGKARLQHRTVLAPRKENTQP
jgi:hypothetical protein